MEPEINCSGFCDSVPGQELTQRPFQDFCRAITSSDSRKALSPVSPVLVGIVWTFLSSGLLLVIFFLVFTIRCKKNRIVKMSSPNLNFVTLLGSCLTYSSAYLFGIQNEDALVGSSMETLIQVRLSLLCIGTSLVFGPVLGKSWRLYKVFTQRVPDKRVVTGRDVSCSLTSTHFCASLYSDVWIALILGCKGLLLLYGAYLAGLTDHVSSPPVNQSLTIMVGVNLAVLAAGLLLVVTRYLHSWPNLVFGLTSGGIFVCTTTINCFIFIPQLKQWKAFEEENQTIRRMAKYFSTPCKSFHPQCADEQNCHPRGAQSSMERLLTEKNAVIESLQEQVNNAKEKLVRLMSAGCPSDAPERSTGTQAEAWGHSTTAGGPSEGPSLSQNHSDASPAAPDSGSTSMPSSNRQSLEGPVEDPSPSSGQMEKASDLNNFSSCSPKPRAEQSGRAEGGSQVLPDPSQGLLPGDDSVPQRQRQQENSKEPSGRLSRVNSVIREKLREVLQDLSLGPEAPGPSSPPHPQPPLKSPQKIPFPRELGFSPYMVRRRQRAPSRFHGSGLSSLGHRACGTGSGAWGGLQAENVGGSSPDHHRAAYPRPTSKKPFLPLEPRGRPEMLAPSHPHERAAGGSGPAERPTATPSGARTSPDLPGRPPGSPVFPSASTPCSYLDSESSSSDDDEFFCRCHRPYCEICFQSSSDSSTSEPDPGPAGARASWEKPWASSKPVVNFKDDLKPTLV
ncbi:probable G-protein coupled receptor 156 isoform X2 [Echinops telfairi]|uniref:Probable G-protein coupled receptor 156 isoform X2 n=1 Tax=Echinops telfairi TaxID=9371 RepID=A0AC55DEN9_ECHTE|nr:probable G-protein coupled receptor 156 isoform X2 [Echinops telfairi]